MTALQSKEIVWDSRVLEAITLLCTDTCDACNPMWDMAGTVWHRDVDRGALERVWPPAEGQEGTCRVDACGRVAREETNLWGVACIYGQLFLMEP